MSIGHTRYRCLVILKDGTTCNRPAFTLDEQLGCYVCEAHEVKTDDHNTAEGGDHEQH